MKKTKIGVPPRKDDNSNLSLIGGNVDGYNVVSSLQWMGTKRAGDIHKKQVDDFTALHGKIVKAVDNEVQRSMENR